MVDIPALRMAPATGILTMRTVMAVVIVHITDMAMRKVPTAVVRGVAMGVMEDAVADMAAAMAEVTAAAMEDMAAGIN
jgi:hypothetical protein